MLARRYSPSGFYSLKRRFEAGILNEELPVEIREAMEADRSELEAHLGGEVSATQMRLIESVLILDCMLVAALAAVQQWGAIQSRRKEFYPVAREIPRLIEQRRKLLENLGWDRRQRPIDPLVALDAAVERVNHPVKRLEAEARKVERELEQLEAPSR